MLLQMVCFFIHLKCHNFLGGKGQRYAAPFYFFVTSSPVILDIFTTNVRQDY